MRIVDMAHRHRRYGYRMIHLRLRHEGWAVNAKRVRRLYRLEKPDGLPSEAQEIDPRGAATVTSA